MLSLLWLEQLAYLVLIINLSEINILNIPPAKSLIVPQYQ